MVVGGQVELEGVSGRDETRTKRRVLFSESTSTYDIIDEHIVSSKYGGLARIWFGAIAILLDIWPDVAELSIVRIVILKCAWCGFERAASAYWLPVIYDEYRQRPNIAGI